MDAVLSHVVDPLGWPDVLVMMDSLHGDNPMLQWLEEEGLMGVIGGSKLAAVRERLEDMPDDGWNEVPEKKQKGFMKEDVEMV